jgi:drug/metabolite transporter (DMT)-like permease
LWRDIPKGKFWLVLARAACGFTAFMLWMIALAQSPLSLNMVIANLMPFWSSLLALWLYGETIFCIEIVGMGICLGAVAGMALGANTDITEGKTGNTYDQVWIGVLLVLVVSWVSAFMAVIGRLGRNIHWSIFLFWYGLLGSTLPFIGLLI